MDEHVSFEPSLTHNGEIKWFDNAKGYGFIKQPGASDTFVHINQLRKSGINTIAEGAKVSFSTVKGPKGSFAVNVKLCDGKHA